MFVLSILLDASFYLVRNVGYYLNCLAEVVATTLLVDNSLIDSTRSNTIMTSGLNVCKTFIVPQVKICLHAIGRYIAFSVFIGIERTRIYIDVGVKLLDRDFVASSLQQLTDTCRNNALSQRRNDATCDEYILCFHKRLKKVSEVFPFSNALKGLFRLLMTTERREPDIALTRWSETYAWCADNICHIEKVFEELP